MSRLRRSERGQTVVEFALVLPIVAALVIGLLQFGKIIYAYIGITHLANEGARYGAVSNFPNGAANPGAFLCPRFGADAATNSRKVVVALPTDNGTSGKAGNAVTVTVSENYKIVPYFGGATVLISSSASMRLEQAATYGAGTTTC